MGQCDEREYFRVAFSDGRPESPPQRVGANRSVTATVYTLLTVETMTTILPPTNTRRLRKHALKYNIHLAMNTLERLCNALLLIAHFGF